MHPLSKKKLRHFSHVRNLSCKYIVTYAVSGIFNLVSVALALEDILTSPSLLSSIAPAGYVASSTALYTSAAPVCQSYSCEYPRWTHLQLHQIQTGPAENNFAKWRTFFRVVLRQYQVEGHVDRPYLPM
jgi:hypothetical protein